MDANPSCLIVIKLWIDLIEIEGAGWLVSVTFCFARLIGIEASTGVTFRSQIHAPPLARTAPAS